MPSLIKINGLKIIKVVSVPTYGMDVPLCNVNNFTNDPKDFLPLLPKPLTLANNISKNSFNKELKSTIKKKYLELGLYTNPNSKEEKGKKQKNKPILCVVPPKEKK